MHEGGVSKILFVEPPRNYWFIMGEYLPPPTGLLSLAAYLRAEVPDIEIIVVDCQAERIDWDGLRRAIESTEPTIVATSGFTANAYTCARTAEIAKTIGEDIVTIVGGSHFSFVPEDSLTQFAEIDYIVRGEGEVTLAELVKVLQRGGSVEKVNGVSYRMNGNIVHNPDRPQIAALDILPYPAYDLVEHNIKRYHFSMMAGRNTRYMILEGSRGCDHRCSFCTQWRHWQGICRRKSPKRIADEIECLNETYGGVFLWLTDDNFEYGTRSKELYEELRRRKCSESVMLFFQARTDDVASNPELVSKMRDVGNYWVMMGVESSSEERLREFRKDITPSDAYNAVKVLNDNDIFSHAMFMIGARRDTAESIEAERDFSLSLGADLAIYTVLTPFPGTSYYETAEANGWIEDSNYSHYDMAHAIMPTETLSRNEVQHELYNCYKAFYGSYSKSISGIFSKKKLKRTMYRHMASQHVLRKLRSLI
ncbi:MAG: cobalamin-dependent protein [Methanobacteriota archaeon]|nr:MAG: cobalamin-dependent protein [Euryarchaeota archaeon]